MEKLNAIRPTLNAGVISMSTKEQFAPDAFKESSPDVSENSLTPHELAFLAGTTDEIIAQLADLDLIVPCPLRRSALGETSQGELSEASARSETPLFRVEDVGQVRRILRMRRHLQISFDSMALIFDLIDRIDALEKLAGEMKKE